MIEGKPPAVEIYLPASVEGWFPIRAPKIQHLTQPFQYPDDGFFLRLEALALANIDVKMPDTVPDNLGAAVANNPVQRYRK